MTQLRTYMTPEFIDDFEPIQRSPRAEAPVAPPEDLDTTLAMMTSAYDRYLSPYVPRQRLGAYPVGGEGTALWLSDGRELLDFASAGFGYGDPTLRTGLEAQLRRTALSSRVLVSRPLGAFVKELAAYTPGDLEMSYVCNSPEEAVDAALKLTRGYHQRRHRIVVLDGARHGSMSVPLYLSGQFPAGAFSFEPVRIPYGDMDALAAIDHSVAAVLVKTVGEELGLSSAPAAYLQAIRAACSRVGALMIADENVSSLGRSGARFGCDLAEVVPDILVFGRGLGGGAIPLGVCIARRSVFGPVYDRKNPALHGSTTGANPLSCAAGLLTLDVIEREAICARTRGIEPILRHGLTEIARRFPEVVAAGCCGVLGYVDLGLPGRAERAAARALSAGLLLAWTPGDRWLGLRPCSLVSTEQAEASLERLRLALTEGVMTFPAVSRTPATPRPSAAPAAALGVRPELTRDELVDACITFWNPMAGLFYDVAKRSVEAGAEGCWVRDEQGHQSLDFACSYGVFIVGHGNAHVRSAVEGALGGVPMLPAGVEHPSVGRYARKLAGLLPSPLCRVFFASSGAEAAELALRMSLLYHPTRRRIVVAQNSYHGKTLGALNILGQRGHRIPFGPYWEHVDFVPFGDAQAIEELVRQGDVAAVFLEPVRGGPFLEVPPPGYLTRVRAVCNQQDTLFVLDEIQTGFGRVGKMFAMDFEKVVPDLVILSKGITGGHIAIANVVTTDAVLSRIGNIGDDAAAVLGSDTGGSPIACAAALAAIEEVERLSLPDRAARLGPRLLTGLDALAKRHPKLIVKAVGVGLMTGIAVRNPAVESGITMLLGKRGVHAGHSMNEHARHPVLRFYPPLTVTEEEIDILLAALDETLQRLEQTGTIMLDLLNVIATRQYALPKSILRKAGGRKPSTLPGKMRPADVSAGQPTAGGR